MKHDKATIAYQRERYLIDSAVAEILDRLERLDALQEKRPSDWGFVGTAAETKARLHELRDWLS